MARLIKEREMDQELYEALNFSMRDDADLLFALSECLVEDVAETKRAAEADRLAAEAEDRARLRTAAAEHELKMARADQQLAHEQRMVSRKGHSAAKQREERKAKIVKALRIHTTRARQGIVEWGGFKGFASEQLDELRVFGHGGLNRMLDAHKRAHADERETEISASEAEAI